MNREQRGGFFKRAKALVSKPGLRATTAKIFLVCGCLYSRTFIDFYDGFSMNIMLGQNIRFGNKFSLSQNISFQPSYNNIGYTYVNGSADINFAKRRVKTIENILSAKYSFTNKMGITFRARHYLSSVENSEFLCCSAMALSNRTRDFTRMQTRTLTSSISIWYIPGNSPRAAS